MLFENKIERDLTKRFISHFKDISGESAASLLEYVSGLTVNELETSITNGVIKIRRMCDQIDAPNSNDLFHKVLYVGEGICKALSENESDFLDLDDMQMMLVKLGMASIVILPYVEFLALSSDALGNMAENLTHGMPLSNGIPCASGGKCDKSKCVLHKHEATFRPNQGPANAPKPEKVGLAGAGMDGVYTLPQLIELLKQQGLVEN